MAGYFCTQTHVFVVFNLKKNTHTGEFRLSVDLELLESIEAASEPQKEDEWSLQLSPFAEASLPKKQGAGG